MSQRFGRAASVALIVAIAVLAASCGGASGGDPVSLGTGGGSGTLVFSRPDGIYDFNLESGETKPLIMAEEPNSYILDPAVSPDGARIAYVVQPPSKIIDNRYDAGSDLWIANRDGSGRTRLYEHQQLNALVRYPQWADDGHVVAIIQEFTFAESPNGPLISNVDYTLQRVDVATGEREQLLEDALAFTLSPVGDRVAYARLDPQVGEVFESVALAGGEPRVLVAAEERLQPYNSPRYSPDGSSIAFASADQTAVRASDHLVSVQPVRASALNGLPQDIWLVDAKGGKPRLLAELKEDLPALCWSDDGEHIYVLGADGLYDVNVASGAVARLGEGSFHGQLDWTP